MHIQSYQIHNVLNVYRRQLSQGTSVPSRNARNPMAATDAVTLSSEGRNHSIMEKVAARVIEKITNVAPETNPESVQPAQVNQNDQRLFRLQRENAFTFNTINGDNQKETRSISIENSQVLMNRLDELAKSAVDRKLE